MRLRELLSDLPNVNLPTENPEVSGIFTDSRAVISGSIFVAIKGHVMDGMDFIPQAVERGAKVIISHTDVPAEQRLPHILYFQHPDVSSVLRRLVSKFYGSDVSRVKVVGVTGTNGKTTTAYLMAHILESVGCPSGMIGTIAYHIRQNVFPSVNTTPGFVELHQLLSKMSQEGVTYCAMEVSSHALDQGRVDGINFSCAVFTNLTDEHLDYHKTKEDYFQAKAKLFTKLSAGSSAVINVDDEYGRRLTGMTQARVITYAVENSADLKAENICLGIDRTKFDVCYEGNIYSIETSLVGKHNIENLMAGIGAALSLGIPMSSVMSVVRSFHPVKGRLEKVETGRDFSVIIDYAHTPDALEKILQTLRAVTDKKILLVFGCGGDRDRTKRPKMGKIAGRLADYTIVTSDNPRTEDPQAILNEIVPGFETKNYEVIADRREAIAKALKIACAGEVVLIAGKGHEDYQILKTGKIPFDERVIVRECLGLL